MQLIYDHLIPGKPVWDFCCDHGYLGTNAYMSGHFPRVYFVDQVKHLIEKLEQKYLAHHEESHPSQAFFIPQAGEDVRNSVEGTVVIAGVGPHSILKILKGLSENQSLKAERLILCSQGGEEILKEGLLTLSNFDYQIGNEDCKIEERGRVRKLLILNKKVNFIV